MCLRNTLCNEESDKYVFVFEQMLSDQEMAFVWCDLKMHCQGQCESLRYGNHY
jgi:hypothetical protein